jgi:hypothetical protein
MPDDQDILVRIRGPPDRIQLRHTLRQLALSWGGIYLSRTSRLYVPLKDQNNEPSLDDWTLFEFRVTCSKVHHEWALSIKQYLVGPTICGNPRQRDVYGPYLAQAKSYAKAIKNAYVKVTRN